MLALMAYGVVAGSLWLLEGRASEWPPLLRFCFHDAVVAALLIAAIPLLERRWQVPREWSRIAAWGTVWLAAPAVLSAGAGTSVASSSQTLLFALVPFFTVFVVARDAESKMALLLPAVIASGGLALILPYVWPDRWPGGVWMGLLLGCALAVAFAGIHLAKMASAISMLWLGALATGASSVACGLAWGAFDPQRIVWRARDFAAETAWAVLLDLPLTLLLMWLLRRMSAISLSTRFLLVPLVGIGGSTLAARFWPPWTTWLGAALVTACGLFLVFDDVVEDPNEPNQPGYLTGGQ